MKRSLNEYALILAVTLLLAGGTSSALQSDNFNDNVMDPAWASMQDEPTILSLAETNQRLEFTFGDNLAAGHWAEAMYVSDGWSFDVTADFAMKVDFSFEGAATLGDTGLAVGLRFNTDGDTVLLAAGADESNYFGYIVQHGGEITKRVWWNRTADTGSLYISYEAAADSLYFSRTGFWAANAVSVLPAYVAGELGATSANVALSAYSAGTTSPLTGSQAYLDNFLIAVPSVPGDANGDGKVDLTDLGILATNWGRTDAAGPTEGDFTDDDAVNLSDLGVLATNWGTGTAAVVPEPMTLTLLAGGSIGLLARRRS